MWVARGHEPGQRRRRLVVRQRPGDRAVVPVAEDHPPAHQVVGCGHVVDHRSEVLDPELPEQVLVVADRGRPPGVERDAVRAVVCVRPAVRPGTTFVGSRVAFVAGRVGRAPPRARLTAVVVGLCLVGRVVVSVAHPSVGWPLSCKSVRFARQAVTRRRPALGVGCDQGVSRSTVTQPCTSRSASANVIRLRTPPASRTSNASSRGWNVWSGVTTRTSASE